MLCNEIMLEISWHASTSTNAYTNEWSNHYLCIRKWFVKPRRVLNIFQKIPFLLTKCSCLFQEICQMCLENCVWPGTASTSSSPLPPSATFAPYPPIDTSLSRTPWSTTVQNDASLLLEKSSWPGLFPSLLLALSSCSRWDSTPLTTNLSKDVGQTMCTLSQ